MLWTGKVWRHWGTSLQNLLLPPQCIVCQSRIEDERRFQICVRCQARLSPAGLAYCCRCGAHWPDKENLETSCRACRQIPLPYESVCCLGNYQDQMRDVVVDMKRSGREAMAIQLGRWLGQRLAAGRVCHQIDIITAVPAHWTKRLQRGCTVTELLVEGLRKSVRRPVVLDLLRSQRRTKKQGRLTTLGRFENVKGCFQTNSGYRLGGQNILVVDDVMTSCATAIEAAKTLSRSGAERLFLAIVARGVKHR